MKSKKVKLLGVTFIVVSLLVFVMMIIHFDGKNDEESLVYSLADYSYELEHFNFQYQVDKIDNYNTAVSIGEELFVEHFGEEVLKEKPFKAYYDDSLNTWLVSGSKIKSNTFGGFAHAIIEENGNVLAIWHEK